jgi:hypothetical protein
LISQNIRSGFELPVRFAAVCGPLRRAAARAGPGERGPSALSVTCRTYSLVGTVRL